MQKLPSKILIIDRDETVLNHVERMLSKLKINVLKARDWEQGIYHFNQNRIDLVIAEKNLNEISGPVLIQKFRHHEVPSKRNTGVLIIQSDPLSKPDELLLKELGDVKVITKPLKEPTLVASIMKSMEGVYARTQVHELKINVLDPLIRKGNAEKAADIAEKKLMDGGPSGMFAASEVLESAERYDRSIEITSALIQEYPKNLKYLNQLARLKMKTGNLKESQRYYEMVDKLAPENLERIEQMAHLYLEMKLPEKSIEKFKTLIKHNPEDPALKFEYFEKLQEAGFEAEAQQFCQETTSAKELVRHFNNKGVLLSKQEKYAEAIAEYDRARRLMPNSKHLYLILYNMAIAHINLKSKDNIEKAHEILEELVILKPDYQKAHEKLALTQKYLKKPA